MNHSDPPLPWKTGLPHRHPPSSGPRLPDRNVRESGFESVVTFLEGSAGLDSILPSVFLLPIRAKVLRNHLGACLTPISGVGPRLKRSSTSGYSARVDSQSGLPHSPATCNTYFRRLSLHALHATRGLFLPEWVTFSLPRSCPCRASSIRRCPRGGDPTGDGAG